MDNSTFPNEGATVPEIESPDLFVVTGSPSGMGKDKTIGHAYHSTSHQEEAES